MSRELIGDLSKVRLLELVRPLVDQKKSGVVVVEGGGGAELYFEGGKIVHGKFDTLSGDDAVYGSMDLDRGRVKFDWRISAEKKTIDAPTEQLMSEWTQREEAWERIKAEVPSSDAVFSIVADSGGVDRTILERQWGVLALCNDTRSVAEVAEQLQRTIFEVSQTIYEMARMGVLKQTKVSEQPGKRTKDFIDESFFVSVETELKRVLGPIARIIVNDTIDAFDETRDKFPRDQVEDFIRTLCD